MTYPENNEMNPDKTTTEMTAPESAVPNEEMCDVTASESAVPNEEACDVTAPDSAVPNEEMCDVTTTESVVSEGCKAEDTSDSAAAYNEASRREREMYRETATSDETIRTTSEAAERAAEAESLTGQAASQTKKAEAASGEAVNQTDGQTADRASGGTDGKTDRRASRQRGRRAANSARHKKPHKQTKGFKIAVVVSLLLTVLLVGGVLLLNISTYRLISGTSSESIRRYEAPANEFASPAGVPDVAEDTEKALPYVNRYAESSDGDALPIEDVVDKCMPSMVAITSTSIEEMQSYFGGQVQQYESKASGTGVILETLEDKVLLVTNNHVIDSATDISVAFVDDTVAEATVLGRDTVQDLAILSVDKAALSDDTLSRIDAVSIGSSADCRVGAPVVAIGNALGYGQSVSSGIISALNRTVVVDGVGHTLIQTDAAINPGNSGGALLNMQGQLIGINEVKYAQTTVEGMGYAIPVDDACRFLDSVLNRETRTRVSEADRSYLGINCVTVPTDYVKAGYPAGVYISEVVRGQAAEKASLQVGDIITSVNGYAVTASEELVDELTYYKTGESVSLTVLRLDSNNTSVGYQSMNVDVTLGSRADAHVDDDLYDDDRYDDDRYDGDRYDDDRYDDDRYDDDRYDDDRYDDDPDDDFYTLPYFR